MSAQASRARTPSAPELHPATRCTGGLCVRRCPRSLRCFASGHFCARLMPRRCCAQRQRACRRSRRRRRRTRTSRSSRAPRPTTSTTCTSPGSKTRHSSDARSGLVPSGLVASSTIAGRCSPELRAQRSSPLPLPFRRPARPARPALLPPRLRAVISPLPH